MWTVKVMPSVANDQSSGIATATWNEGQDDMLVYSSEVRKDMKNTADFVAQAKLALILRDKAIQAVSGLVTTLETELNK